MRFAALAVGGLLLVAAPATAAEAAAGREDRQFEVFNTADQGRAHTLHGFEVVPDCAADTVVLLLHGLSYTGASWDVPGYSYVQILADAGYAAVAVDRLGYGRSVLANGYDVSTLAHADMARQVVEQLREEYDHVVLAGHSAGAETAVTATGVFGAPVDALVPMGYHTFPDPVFLTRDWALGDQVRALQDDYEYFLGTPEHRAEMFYTDNADPDVIAADTAAAVLTPSGEILTISLQPARIGSALVDVPVMAQLAGGDRLFPAVFADLWAAQFVQSPDVTVDVVPGTGHTYMLHHDGPAAGARIADWLADTVGLAGCSPADATALTPTSEATADTAPPAAAAAAPPAAPVAAAAPAPAADTLPATGAGVGFAALAAAVGCARLSPRPRRRRP